MFLLFLRHPEKRSQTQTYHIQAEVRYVYIKCLSVGDLRLLSVVVCSAKNYCLIWKTIGHLCVRYGLLTPYFRSYLVIFCMKVYILYLYCSILHVHTLRSYAPMIGPDWHLDFETLSIHWSFLGFICVFFFNFKVIFSNCPKEFFGSIINGRRIIWPNRKRSNFEKSNQILEQKLQTIGQMSKGRRKLAKNKKAD